MDETSNLDDTDAPDGGGQGANNDAHNRNNNQNPEHT